MTTQEAWKEDAKPKEPTRFGDLDGDDGSTDGPDMPGWLQRFAAMPAPAVDPAQVARDELHARKAEARSIRNRLPEFLASPDFATLEARVPCAKFASIAQGWQWGMGNVLFLGESDEGKTTAAAVLCRRLLRDAVGFGGFEWSQAQGIRWVRAGRLVASMQGWPMGRGECPDFVEAAKASLLVIDDLGWEKDPKLVAELLACRFDAVGEGKAPKATIVTSGQTVKGLIGIYGDAVVKRMIKNGTRQAIIVRSFPKADEAKRKNGEQPDARPPGDQDELARRLGEKP